MASNVIDEPSTGGVETHDVGPEVTAQNIDEGNPNEGILRWAKCG